MKIAILPVFVLSAFLMPASSEARTPVMCTMQYDPVCGTNEKGAYKTYGNGCTLGAEGGTYQHQGECTAAELENRQEGTYTPPAQCTAWFDGCNSCSRSAGGQSMCTLMACMGEPRAGYCRAYAQTPTEEPKPPKPPTVTPPAPVAPVVETPIEASTTPETLEEVELGFFARIWTSIANWFSSLF